MDPYKYFPNRKPNEEVILLLRRHWKAIAHHFLILVITFLIPLIIFFLISRFTSFVFEKESPLAIVIVLSASLYYLFIWLFFFNHWIDYYLDVWVVTNQRILNIEQKGLFSRTISEVSLLKVQDVTSEVKGKLATLLNFGDVHIQTAAEEKRFIFEEIPNPQAVASKIMELHQRVEKEQIAQDQSFSVNSDQNETKPV